jgi:hypothetical protein
MFVCRAFSLVSYVICPCSETHFHEHRELCSQYQLLVITEVHQAEHLATDIHDSHRSIDVCLTYDITQHG